MAKHVMEALGKARVVIEDGKVVEVGEPVVEYCPLFKKYRGIDRFDKESIRENIEFRIKDFGMCTDEREILMDDFLSFGVSELLCMAVDEGILDAAVIASDGVGTCVVTDPRLIQGLGGRISGLMSTSPIDKVMEGVGEENSLEGGIDQVRGVELAKSLGHRRIGVSVALADDARRLRDLHGDDVMLFAVHTTGCSPEDAEEFFRSCDIVTGCASLHIRRLAKDRALIQGGDKVPVYAASPRGKELIEMKLARLGKEPAEGDSDDSPWPLI